VIGNDIVSLVEARAAHRWEEVRFLRKVLSDEEQELLAGQADRHRALWTLWALKESVYKLEYRQAKRRFFAPKYFRCRSWDLDPAGLPVQARIETPQGNYLARIVQQAVYVHAVVALSAKVLSRVCHAVIPLPAQEPAAQSRELRVAAQQAIRRLTQGEARIRTSAANDFPRVWLGNQESGSVLSLSHHGGWGAYAFVVHPVSHSACL
jgi:hypothetical protein